MRRRLLPPATDCYYYLRSSRECTCACCWNNLIRLRDKIERNRRYECELRCVRRKVSIIWFRSFLDHIFISTFGTANVNPMGFGGRLLCNTKLGDFLFEPNLHKITSAKNFLGSHRLHEVVNRSAHTHTHNAQVYATNDLRDMRTILAMTKFIGLFFLFFPK